jgi:tetraacyldisaccharide 4'-kinase
VSIGNLTVGGTGKTTLVLHLASALRAGHADPAIVCRRYRPGAAGRGDEELMFERAMGARAVFAGDSKWRLASRAVAAGHRHVLVDDGFSHWSLERDVDIVLMDTRDPWGGGQLLPAGRMREPHCALQRADIVVLTRLDPGEDPAPAIAKLRPYAPAAHFAAARHRVTGVRPLAGSSAAPAEQEQGFFLVTATGSPAAVERSAREIGLNLVACSTYRDHHWFTDAEVTRERNAARERGARILLTAKDEVRWPRHEIDDVWVLDVTWEWIVGEDTVLRSVRGTR